MKGKRFSEEQIIAVLRESEAGAKTKELCRDTGSRKRPSTSMDCSRFASALIFDDSQDECVRLFGVSRESRQRPDG